MKCNNCNQTIKSGEKFCPHCGFEVGKTVANQSKGLAIASIVLGAISLLGGCVFILFPIIGLILGLCQNGKSNEKTVGIILNSIGLFFAIVIISIFGLFVRLVYHVAKNADLNKIESFIEERVDLNNNDEFFGTWNNTANKKHYILRNNSFTYTDEEEDISYDGIYTLIKIYFEDNEVIEGLDVEDFDAIKARVDGTVDEDNIYFGSFFETKKSSISYHNYLWMKLEDDNKYCIYNIKEKTLDYYIKEVEDRVIE